MNTTDRRLAWPAIADCHFGSPSALSEEESFAERDRSYLDMES